MSVNEYYCQDGEIMSDAFECRYGCAFENGGYIGKCAGSPLRITRCTDSDGGFNYFNKGTVSSDEFSRTDFCGVHGADGNPLFEWTCKGSQFEFNVRYCRLCSDGSCVAPSCNRDEDCPSQSVSYCSKDGLEACSESAEFKCENPGTPESQCVVVGIKRAECELCELGCGKDVCLELPEPKFIRGDANEDSKVDLSDAVYILGYLFQGQPSPLCQDVADTNDDGKMDLTDAIFLLNYLFKGDKQLPEPYPAEGTDPTDDLLIC
ncbi:MAG: dockerin type I repeat-containing protein [Nanoarchaeota archaeon]|nr:dockerin type I repeat-containing protein [Nanoarchaeota archaeon]